MSEEQFPSVWKGLENEPLSVIFIDEPLLSAGGVFANLWIDQNLGILGMYSAAGDTPKLCAIIFQQSKGWSPERVDEWFRLHPEYRREQPSTQKPSPPEPPRKETPGVFHEAKKPAKKEAPELPVYAVVSLGSELVYMDLKKLKHIQEKRD